MHDCLPSIVAAHSWVTSPFAHVAAKKLQPDVERSFPHIPSSTPELVRAIEALRFSPHQVLTTFLITGDVEELYANIQQDQALDTVGGHLTNILQGGQLNAPLRAEVLRFAMQFVFKNAYMRFGTDVYKQLNVIPMGSPLSPPFANALVALFEDVTGEWEHPGDSLSSHLPTPECMRLFRRLIDDYTIILSDVQRHHVDALLQEIDRRLALAGLKVQWVVSQTSCDTLDLTAYKPPDMHETGKLAFHTHAKWGNRHAYVHRASMHNPAVFPGLVRGELYRHAINCSTHEWYWHNAQLFRHRLMRRGSTELDIDPVFRSVRYSEQQRLLYAHDAPQVDAAAAEAMQPPLRVFLKMPYDVITCSLPLQQRMRAVLSDLRAAWQLTLGTEKLLPQLERVQPMTCWLRAKTLGGKIMRSDEI